MIKYFYFEYYELSYMQADYITNNLSWIYVWYLTLYIEVHSSGGGIIIPLNREGTVCHLLHQVLVLWVRQMDISAIQKCMGYSIFVSLLWADWIHVVVLLSFAPVNDSKAALHRRWAMWAGMILLSTTQAVAVGFWKTPWADKELKAGTSITMFWYSTYPSGISVPGK